MAIAPKHHIIELKEGRFNRDSTHTDLLNIFSELRRPENSNKKILIHFHGGLVSERAFLARINGLDKNGGRGLYDVYTGDQQNDVYPIFVIWKSGFMDVVRSLLLEIGEKTLFTRLLLRVTQLLKGKANKERKKRIWNRKSRVREELESLQDISAQLGALNPKSRKEDLNLGLSEQDLLDIELGPEDKLEMEQELLSDDRLHYEALLIAEGTKGSLRNFAVGNRILSGRSIHAPVSRALLAGIEGDLASHVSGSFKSPTMVTGVISTVVRVIGRYRNKTNHSLHGTIVEEVLREFFIDKIGARVWDEMKQYARDAYENDERVFGGTALLKELGRLYHERQIQGRELQVNLVAHSAGALHVCNLLQAADRYQLPQGLKFNVIKMAAACNFNLFSEVLEQNRHRINKLRSFGMSDKLELQDVLINGVGVFYPHSLLCFVSALLEKEVCKPIVGMERFHKESNNARPTDRNQIKTVKDYLGTQRSGSLWAKCSDGVGLNCDVDDHGRFDNNEVMLESIMHIVHNGYEPIP